MWNNILLQLVDILSTFGLVLNSLIVDVNAAMKDEVPLNLNRQMLYDFH